MPLRCPLCLEEAIETAAFVRFCSVHPERSELVSVSGLDPEGDFEKLRCPEPRCDGNGGTTLPGVFLAHVGCQFSGSPFGDLSAVPKSFEILPPSGSGVTKVKHWETGLFRQLEACRAQIPVGGHQTMFFPLSLLVADVDGRSTTVALTGAKNVGKSFLAMQALDPQGYEKPTEKPGGAEDTRSTDRDEVPGVGLLLADFVYCSPEGAGATAVGETFLRTLHARELMQRNESFHGWIPSTNDRRRNLKTAFFTEAAPSAPTARARGARSFFDTGVRGVGKFLGRALGNSRATRQPMAISFFDTAGEVSSAPGSSTLMELERKVDVIAILAGWDDLTSNDANLATAVGRLREVFTWRGSPRQPRCCVVVTKVDLLGKTQPGRLDALRAAPRAGDREVLLSELSASASIVSAPNRKEYLGLLTSARPFVDEVFLIWHENVDDPVPVSYGLREFVAWCLLGHRPAPEGP